MKFQLLGEVRFFEEIHTQGCRGSEQILEEFEADSANEAIEKARQLIAEIEEEFPRRGAHGPIEFRGLDVELRTIEPVWTGELNPETVEKMVPVTTQENRLTEVPFPLHP